MMPYIIESTEFHYLVSVFPRFTILSVSFDLEMKNVNLRIIVCFTMQQYFVLINVDYVTAIPKTLAMTLLADRHNVYLFGTDLSLEAYCLDCQRLSGVLY